MVSAILQVNFKESRHYHNIFSNFNNLKDPTKQGKEVGLNLYENTDIKISQVKKFIKEVKEKPKE